VLLEVVVLGHELAAGADALLLHLRRSVELLLEGRADLPEGGHGPPAGLELARPGHSVTLALYLHGSFDYLGIRN